jgi:hypothetical protein
MYPMSQNAFTNFPDFLQFLNLKLFQEYIIIFIWKLIRKFKMGGNCKNLTPI